jgi:hypothetical protein
MEGSTTGHPYRNTFVSVLYRALWQPDEYRTWIFRTRRELAGWRCAARLLEQAVQDRR